MNCNYIGKDFGASYIDSRCSGGYLRDLDTCEMSDIPCPKCNHAKWLKYFRFEIIDRGACAFSDGKPRKCNIRPKYRQDRKKIKRWWKQGYDKEAKEVKE